MGSESNGDQLDAVVLRDEILEATYWMLREEDISDTIEATDLTAFLDATDDDIRLVFDRLEDDELFERAADGYELTDRGEYEAKRRFADTFGHMEEGHSHAECGPDCWCHNPEADEEDVCPTAPAPE
ncbi:hypothetical protein [Haloplanus salilacus]|uniref:hypothetical protein n=1 Tax=Haloplanus salilacus TaxID=2949994 RepID=UPI0030D5B5F2